MIKFFPERKTPDLYHSDIVNEIFLEIGLQTDEHKHDLKEILEHAAVGFIKSWKAEKLKQTEAQDLKAIEKTLPYLKKCKAIYETIDTDNGFISTGFGVKPAVFYKPNKYAEALNKIIEDTEAVLIDPMRTSNKTKTRLILNWIWEFSDLWEESNITLSEGRCEENGEYKSQAMNILVKMMSPIKNHIEDPTTITSSMIAEALKENRLYNKQGYLASNPSGAIGTKSNPKVLKTIDFRE